MGVAELRDIKDKSERKNKFKAIFEELTGDEDSTDDDEEAAEPRVLLIEADDGRTPGLYRIVRPVEETLTHDAVLEPRGSDMKVEADTEKYNVGDLVYVMHLCYVPYTRL